MQAAVLREYGEPLEITDVEKPSPDPDGAVIEIEACGVCRSDWHGWQGDMEWANNKPPKGQILGHEPAGRVVETGEEVTELSEGDQVAVPFNIACSNCYSCHHGRSNVCDNVLGLGTEAAAPGAFAEETPVPNAEFNVVKLPDDVSAVDMAALGCRFMTAFHALVHRADVTPGDWVAIHGCGGVGLSAVQIADAMGANVVAVDLDEETLEKAERLGADATVDVTEVEDTPGAVQAETDRGADISMDALGSAETIRNSVLSLGKHGQHLQVGITSSEEEGMVTLPTDLMLGLEAEFKGSAGMPPTRFDEIFRLISTGKVDPGEIVSETITLEAVNDKLEAMTNFETKGVPVINSF